MLLLVGLGNPGEKYSGHRHNIGFMAVDEIIRRHGFDGPRFKFQGEVWEGRLGTEKVLILKPLTFMNDSGRAVGEAMRFYKIEPDDVVVFHDELDLEPGKLRVKLGGGTAGHNGLKSIGRHVGSDFVRVRMGIGHPGQKHLVMTYVLKDFAKADHEWLGPLIDAMAENADLLADDDISRFANKVHLTRFPEINDKSDRSDKDKNQDKNQDKP
jgi:PTH1 family peptidyl-tRNA hydrolase